MAVVSMSSSSLTIGGVRSSKRWSTFSSRPSSVSGIGYLRFGGCALVVRGVRVIRAVVVRGAGDPGGDVLRLLGHIDVAQRHVVGEGVGHALHGIEDAGKHGHGTVRPITGLGK